MISSAKKLRVLVAYNHPSNPENSEDMDSISETAVREEAEAVYNGLLELGHIPLYLPLQDLYQDIMTIKGFQPDIVFNLCEGFRGNAHHEMHAAALWELLDLPYTGNDSFTLGLAQNKILSKRLFESAGILTPPFQVFEDILPETCLSYPLIAKPAREDASIGITQTSVIPGPENLKTRVSKLLQKYNQPVLVEEFIAGREFNISLLGKQPARVLPISEINFSALQAEYHHITGYEAKWLSNHPLYHDTPAISPAQIGDDLQQRLEAVAVQVYECLMGRDYGRVDVRVDEHERIYVLEYNPNPDISPGAGYARALRTGGIGFNEFLQYLLNEALSRKSYDYYS